MVESIVRRFWRLVVEIWDGGSGMRVYIRVYEVDLGAITLY